MTKSNYQPELKLEQALREFDSAASNMVLNPNLDNILEAVNANRRYADALEQIHAYDGGIPEDYARRYILEVEECIAALNGIEKRLHPNLGIPNWLAIMRLSKKRVKDMHQI